MDKDYHRYSKIYELLFQGRRDEIDLSQIDLNMVENTSIADYVWLPLRFEGEKVCIDWLDEWRIEDYE